MTNQPVRPMHEEMECSCLFRRCCCGCAAPRMCCCNCCADAAPMRCCKCCSKASRPDPRIYMESIGSAPKKELPDYPTKYDLISLTRFQKAGGFWDNLDAVKSITGIKIDNLDEVKIQDKDIQKRCVSTILAIAAMRAKSSNEKNSWAMMEQKALAWLKKTLPDVDIEQVITKVQSSI